MEEALEVKGKSPMTEFCRWNDELGRYAISAGLPSVFDKEKDEAPIIKLKYRPKAKPYNPSIAEPLVYHLHGIMDIPQSMVLTEKDYFDFVISINESRDNRLPNKIKQALLSTYLLFIGYRLEDITFRVIFQGVINKFDPSIGRTCMALQLPTSFPKKNQEKIQKYFTAYIKNMYHSDTYCFKLTIFQRAS